MSPNSPVIRIRPVRPSDAAAVRELILALGHENDIKSLAWRISAIEGTPRERVVVAEVDGTVAGLAACSVYRYFHVEGLVCRVTSVSVFDKFRRHGIGKALIDYAEVWAREQGCDRVEITARKQNAAALNFLLKLGYEDTSTRFFKHLNDEDHPGEH